jgi:hypothetical protein
MVKCLFKALQLEQEIFELFDLREELLSSELIIDEFLELFSWFLEIKCWQDIQPVDSF